MAATYGTSEDVPWWRNASFSGMKNLEVLLIGSFSNYLQGFLFFLHPRWCRISSINSISCIMYIYIQCYTVSAYIHKHTYLIYWVYHIYIYLPYLNQPESRAMLGGSATTTWIMYVHATLKKQQFVVNLNHTFF